MTGNTWPVTPACMGGWCRIRERCNHYTAAGMAAPAERLCAPGNDGQLNFIGAVDNPLRRPQNQENATDDLNWLLPSASPAEAPDDALSPAGEPPLPGNPGTISVGGVA